MSLYICKRCEGYTCPFLMDVGPLWECPWCWAKVTRGKLLGHYTKRCTNKPAAYPCRCIDQLPEAPVTNKNTNEDEWAGFEIGWQDPDPAWKATLIQNALWECGCCQAKMTRANLLSHWREDTDPWAGWEDPEWDSPKGKDALYPRQGPPLFKHFHLVECKNDVVFLMVW